MSTHAGIGLATFVRVAGPAGVEQEEPEERTEIFSLLSVLAPVHPSFCSIRARNVVCRRRRCCSHHGNGVASPHMARFGLSCLFLVMVGSLSGGSLALSKETAGPASPEELTRLELLIPTGADTG